MSSGGADMVPVLFSSGSGPVDESAYPYHGREARPEAWVVEKEPEQWIKDYMQENEDKIVPADGDDPGFTEEDLRAEAEAELKKKQAMIEAGDYLLWYSGDDWTIPDTEGKSARMQPSSCVLKDTWSIPKLTVMSASAQRRCQSGRKLHERQRRMAGLEGDAGRRAGGRHPGRESGLQRIWHNPNGRQLPH